MAATGLSVSPFTVTVAPVTPEPVTSKYSSSPASVSTWNDGSSAPSSTVRFASSTPRFLTVRTAVPDSPSTRGATVSVPPGAVYARWTAPPVV